MDSDFKNTLKYFNTLIRYRKVQTKPFNNKKRSYKSKVDSKVFTDRIKKKISRENRNFFRHYITINKDQIKYNK